MKKLTYHEGQYPDGSACFFILEQPDPGMTYEGIPQEPRVIATVTTEKMAILFCVAPELLEAANKLAAGIWSGSGRLQKMVENLECAIAKAEGK